VLTSPWLLPALRGLARGLHIAGSFSLFGTCLIAGFLLPAACKPSLRRPLKILAWASFALLIVAGLIWFILQTADMSGATDLADIWAALPIVATSTRFGNLLIGRTAAAFLAILLFQCRLSKPAALVAGLAVIAEAWLGHGGAMTGAVGNLLLASSVCHLASGGAWLGSLPALRLSLQRLPIDDAAHIAKKFSPLGIACVIGLTASALLQYVFLIGKPRALFDNGYGLVALFKIVLFATLVGLAAINRQRLAPALTAHGEHTRTRILRTVTAEITIGLAVLLAAGLLLQLTPPTMAIMLNQQSN
jgi:putative copper export protein